MTKKRPPTKAEQAYMDRVRGLGCIICLRPAQLHHPRFMVGMSQRASHRDVIPLCADHHLDGGHGVAIHAGKKTFEQAHGTEEYLLRKTKEMLDV